MELIERFDVATQARLLACCDDVGIPQDTDVMLDIINEAAPDLAHPRWAEQLFDEVCQLWLDRHPK